MRPQPTGTYSPISFYTTKELLLRQSQGKFLSFEEKERVKRYAQNKRKERVN